MINHARTLLMNRSGANQSLAGLGEEHIPDTFKAQALPGWLKSYHAAVFGAAPDNTYLNFQVDRLLRLVHKTDYESYLFGQDSRITYAPRAESAFNEVDYALTWSTSDPFIVGVNRVGDLIASAAQGRMHYQWSLVLAAGGAVTVTNLRSQETASVNAFNASTPQLSSLIPLPGYDISVKLDLLTGAAAAWTGTAYVNTLLRPTEELHSIVSRVASLAAFRNNLFGTDRVEPYLTFSGLWDQDTFPEKLAGFVLALIYRLEAYRVSGVS